MDFFDIHTHSGLPRKYTSIRNIYPDQAGSVSLSGLYSAGLHPWFIREQDYREKLVQIAAMAKMRNIVAVGETGLDKLSESPMSLQLRVFEEHICIAESVGKPLIIHCVRAFQDILNLKKKMKTHVPWVIHGFNAKPAVADLLVVNGLCLSFGNALLNPHSNAVKVLPVVPQERIFFETDDSVLPLPQIYEAACKLLSLQMEELTEIIRANFETTFMQR